MSFYSVYIPQKEDSLPNGSQVTNVFQDKSEALEFLKQHKDARLKMFSNSEDATKYSLTGPDDSQYSSFPILPSTYTAINLEKGAYRTPTRRQLSELRDFISFGNYDKVRSLIWENPRFLISSGDTPMSLKEGYRFNALHICAICNQPKIAKLILETITDIEFIELLYGKNNEKVCTEVSGILLDYYLNTPEKGRCETPLHLASKFGFPDVVEVLTSYRECKMLPNKDGLLPEQIICSRSQSEKEAQKITTLLGERFFVPVIRSINNSVPPVVGKPFSINDPPKLDGDPLSPKLEIQAIAGPMSKEKAVNFCRRWKTPPRLNNHSLPLMQYSNNTPSGIITSTPTKSTPRPRSHSLLTPNGKTVYYTKTPQKSHNGSYTNNRNISMNKENKILEDNNNKVKEQNNMNHYFTPRRKRNDLFSQYRDNCTDSPVVFDDVDSTCTSHITENNFGSPSFKERHLKLADVEKGLEVIGRELAKENIVEWKEYWDFLGVFIDIRSPEGLSKLENFLAKLKVKDGNMSQEPVDGLVKIKVKDGNKSQELVDGLISAFDKLSIRDEHNKFMSLDNDKQAKAKSGSVTAPQLTTPYTCVEKSLQVFAKRMTKNLLNNVDSINSINDAFISELKRLKSLIVSFMDDSRFLNVNFTKVHSRFAYLIVNYLEDTQHIDVITKSKIQKCLQQIVDTIAEKKEHLQCVCTKILLYVKNNIPNNQLNNFQTEENYMQIWLEELTCECKWDKISSRKDNRRSRFGFHKDCCYTATNCSNEIPSEENDKTQAAEAAESTDEEDVFWSDVGSHCDSEEGFFTPPESISSSFNDVCEDSYDVFLQGNKPTKRDLDVLNAISDLEISPEDYPHINAWMSAVLYYTNKEMEKFYPCSVVLESFSLSHVSVHSKCEKD